MTTPSWISTLSTASIAADMTAADVNGTVTYAGLETVRPAGSVSIGNVVLARGMAWRPTAPIGIGGRASINSQAMPIASPRDCTRAMV